MPREIRE